MSLRGLPDFYRPIIGEGCSIFLPFESNLHADELLLLPDGLTVGVYEDGKPDLMLEYIISGVKPYGVLSFGVSPHYSIDEAFNLARESYPNASLKPAHFITGYLRILPIGDTPGVSAETLAAISQPVKLVWNGLTSTRFRLPLPATTIKIVEDFLKGKMLLFSAYAEMELLGVLPRLQITARFNPKLLLERLHNINGTAIVSDGQLFSFFHSQAGLSLFELTGPAVTDTPSRRLAQLLANMVRVRFGRAIPAPEPFRLLKESCLLLPEINQMNNGLISWNLAEPKCGSLITVLSWHPFEEAKKIIKKDGIEPFISTNRIDELKTGAEPISISVNLPNRLPEIKKIVVDLYAPPNRSYRKQAIVVTMELLSPELTATALLRFSPQEPIEYKYDIKLILNDNSEISRPDRKLSEWPINKGNYLLINVDELPARFIQIEAQQSLLAKANLEVICNWNEGERVIRRELRIEGSREFKAVTTLLLPYTAANAQMIVEATPLNGGQSLQLGPMPAQSLNLGLYSFREFGRHIIDVTVIFDHCESIIVELKSAAGGTETTPERLYFTLDNTEQKWSWTAFSPFEAGYYYRVNREYSDQAATSWSKVTTPFQPLIINLKDQVR